MTKRPLDSYDTQTLARAAQKPLLRFLLEGNGTEKQLGDAFALLVRSVLIAGPYVDATGPKACGRG